MTAVGTRVIAIRDSDQEEVRLFGYGVYAGDHPRPGSEPPSPEDLRIAEEAIRISDANPLNVRPVFERYVAEGRLTQAEADERTARAVERQATDRARPMADRVAELAHRLACNPRIDLDDGGVVWGFQCWWAEADDPRTIRMLNGRRVVTVSPPGH